MSELTQEQLLSYVEAAITFFEEVVGYIPGTSKVQALLRIAGIDESLEHIKICGDIVLDLRDGPTEATQPL